MKLEKVCEKHGFLDAKDILVHKSNQYENGKYLRCGLCRDEQSWNYQGRSCKHHGLLQSDDIKANGRCKLCHRQSEKNRRAKNPELERQKRAIYKTKDQLLNPAKWDAYYKKCYQRQKELHGSDRALKEILRMHKLTREQYDQMVAEQSNLCKICNEPETRAGRTKGTIARLVVDHCHITGQVRGLLCMKCNLMLSYARDRLDVLVMGYAYLEASRKMESA